MGSSVPEIDQESSEPAKSASLDSSETPEYRVLKADAKAKENLNRESDQRYSLRKLVIWVCIALMVAMCGLLLYVVCSLVESDKVKASPSIFIAAYLAPIASMTTVAIALLVAAFRGYRDSDEQTLASRFKELLSRAGLMT